MSGYADGYTAVVDLRTSSMVKGRYRLDDIVGRGGMAEVWAARDERLERDVAIKVLRSDLHSRPDVRDRLRREAKAAARLDHPGIVRILDADEVDGVPFLVMERLPGETLADRYSDGGVDDSWLMRAGARVAQALACAHRAGVIHRDVKPGNIMITGGGDVCLGDFGIATSADVSGDLTTAGLVVGTPAYLAPERIEGGPATPQSDVYGLGVVLYEGFAGERPFHGAGPAAVARSVLRHQVPPLGSVRPDLPVALTGAIDRAMAKAPEDRHLSAEELAPELLAAVASAGALSGAGHPADDPDATVALAIDDTHVLPTATAAAVAAPTPALLSQVHETAADGSRAARERWRALDRDQQAMLRRLAVGAVAAVVAVLLAVAGAITFGGPEPTPPVGERPEAETAPAATQTDPAEPAGPAPHGKGDGGDERRGGDKDDKEEGKEDKDD